MNLDYILDHPRTALRYLERYVNDGSPSGFAEQYTTLPETSPFGHSQRFTLWIVGVDPSRTKEYGHLPDVSALHLTPKKDWLLVHPDMVKTLQDAGLGSHLRRSRLLVSPTASGRTVQFCRPMQSDYVKLHYAGILGRMRRELPYAKAIAGPEVSHMLTIAISRSLLPPELSVFQEPFARIVSLELDNTTTEWGMVWRSGKPYGPRSHTVKCMIPGFALFSSDRRNLGHAPLLPQIIRISGKKPDDFIQNIIFEPLIRCYFTILLSLGLQPEWNAQNLVFGFPRDFSHAVLIMRDLESVDKDLTMRKTLGLSVNLDSAPYKCLEESQYNYTIKHSFMYDFKLGESLLGPLILIMVQHYGKSRKYYENMIQECAAEYISRLPSGFFPRDRWYLFKRVMIDHSLPDRPYVEAPNPRFRFH